MPSSISIEIRKSIQKETAHNDEPLEDQRAGWVEYAQTLELAEGTILRTEEIAGVPCLWVSNEDAKGSLTILYLHGGGLVDGSIVTHREFVSRLSKISGYPVLMVEYRLVPEHPFPAALDDVLSVYRELIEGQNFTPDEIVFGGDSSGGGLAVSALLRLRDSGMSLPKCAFTLSGVFDMTLSAESMQSQADLDPCLSYEALKGWQTYFEDGVELTSPQISPLFGDLHKLPPILLQAGDHEVWRDDTTRLAAKIRESGGTADLKIWDSMWHVWPMYSDLPEAKEAIEEIRDFLVVHQ